MKMLIYSKTRPQESVKGKNFGVIIIIFNNIFTITEQWKIIIVPMNGLIEDVMAYHEKTTWWHKSFGRI